MKKVVSCTLIMTLLILLLVPMSAMAFTVTQLPTPGRVNSFDISKTKNAINLYETGMKTVLRCPTKNLPLPRRTRRSQR